MTLGTLTVHVSLIQFKNYNHKSQLVDISTFMFNYFHTYNIFFNNLYVML